MKKIALVTGASSGIGKATATRLSEAGFKVYGSSRRGTDGSKKGYEMLALDVTSDASVQAAVAEVIAQEGRIDLLVNNAGFGVAPAGAEESTVEQAQAIFDTNFFGVVRMTRAVLPHMRARGGQAASSTSVLCLASCQCPTALYTPPANMLSKVMPSPWTTNCATGVSVPS
jgi:NAD(P)-dependent dehydrogenase (short-subunit alcohol dehydrogenase family)